jgi:hypothetical protein
MLNYKDYSVLKNMDKNKLNVSAFKLIYSFFLMFKQQSNIIDIENKDCSINELMEYVTNNKESLDFFTLYSQIYLYDEDCEKLNDFIPFMYINEGIEFELIDARQEDKKEVIKIVVDYVLTIMKKREFLFQGVE